MQRHQAPLKELKEGWIGLPWDCNGKNTPTKEEEEKREDTKLQWGKNTSTKEEETEREKKLNQRLYTVQDKEEEDGVKDTGRSQREEHNEGC